MDKYIFNENNSLWYELVGDYYFPCLGIGWNKDKDKPASSLHRKGFPVCPYCAIRALLRRGLHPFWGRYQDGARQSRTRHRRLYPGRVRARHRPNEAGAPPPYGELHQGRFRPVREKQNKNSRNPPISGVSWSCYPDLNWRPHPYQQPKEIFYNLF